MVYVTRPLRALSGKVVLSEMRFFANYPADHHRRTLSDSVKLWMIPVGALLIALYLWTPKTGKGIAIYGAIVVAMLIVYFALPG